MPPAEYQGNGLALYGWELEEILYVCMCLCPRIWNQAVWKYVQVVLWTLIATLCCLASLKMCRVHWWNLIRSWKLETVMPAVVWWRQVTQLNKLLPWSSKTWNCCDPLPLLSLVNLVNLCLGTSVTGSTSVNWNKAEVLLSLFRWEMSL